MKMYKFFVLVMAVAILGMSMASAVNLKVDSLEINGHTISSTATSSVSQDYKRGDKLDIYVCVEALSDVYNAQIYADITGYQYATKDPSKIHDMTDTFDLMSGHSDCYTLNLEVPTLIDQDYFKLRITSDDRNGTSVDNTYQLYLKGINKNNAIEIRDFTIDPQSVAAGRAFTAQVQVRNLADSTINDLKVTMSIPELNIQTSDYMDSIDSDKSKTFEQLLLRVPDCTKAGTYDVQFVVEYDNYESTTTDGTIKISEGTCGAVTGANGQSTTVINVPNNQEAAQGTSVVYPVVINNQGSTSKTYSLSVSGASTWANVRMDPSSVVVVPAGQSKTVYLYAEINKDAELGDKAFTLTVDDGTDTKSVPLSAKITQNASSSDAAVFKQVLEIGLIVLVVILIIVGLIIGFNKMKDKKQETEPYY